MVRILVAILDFDYRGLGSVPGQRTEIPSRKLHSTTDKNRQRNVCCSYVLQVLHFICLFATQHVRSWASRVALVVKNPPASVGNIRDTGSIPGSGRAWQPTSVFLPGESHGQRSLAGYSPLSRKKLDTTEVT